jgi:hypothetical protein
MEDAVTGSPGPGRSSRGWRLLPPLIFLIAPLPFLPALDGPFLHWDDSTLLIANPGWKGLGWSQLGWMFTSTLSGHYMPLAWLTLALNYVLGGSDPRGYHVGNVLLHATNAVLVYLLALRLLRAAGSHAEARVPRPDVAALGAAVAALAFAVHPLRVEPVAWVSARPETLSGCFFLLSILAYLRAVEARTGAGARGWWAASLGAFVLGGLSKAVVMPLPLVLLLLDLYPLGRVRALGWRRALVEKVPFVALAALIAVAAVWARSRGAGFTSYEQYEAGARLAMTAYSLVYYPWKFLWPVDLTPLSELPVRVDPLACQFVVPELALVVVTAALLAVRRRWPAALTAWVYSAIMVLPVSGLVHSGNQLVHDRYSYLAGLGPALLAGATFAWILGASLRPRLVVVAGSVAACLVLAGWAAGSWRQSRIWRDSETLWRWAVDLQAGCAVCANNLAAVLVHEGPLTPERAREAEGHLRRALAKSPAMSVAYFSLGEALLAQNRADEAETAWREFIRLAPTVADGPARLGLLYLEQRRPTEAVPLLRRALALDPGRRSVRADLVRALKAEAQALADVGHAAEAAALLAEAARLGS